MIGSYLLLVLVMPLALSAALTYRTLPTGRQCPECDGDTIPLVHRALRLAGVFHRHAQLQRRWCLCCGWEGTTRVARQARRRADPAPSPPGGTTPPVHCAATPEIRTLDVRSLDVDGVPWRVMLQCWKSTGLCHGRLVFVGPAGKLWLDAVESFSGDDTREVLGHARSLPDPLLEYRLRRLVSG